MFNAILQLNYSNIRKPKYLRFLGKFENNSYRASYAKFGFLDYFMILR